MNDKLPRRTFLVVWLSSMLTGWLGRSPATAAPKSTPSPTLLNAPAGQSKLLPRDAPNGKPLVYSACLLDGVAIDTYTGIITGDIIR